jgi:hypothetical protein
MKTTIKGTTQNKEKMTITIDLHKIVWVSGQPFYLGELKNAYGCKRIVLESINAPNEIKLRLKSKGIAGKVATHYEVAQ